MSGRLATGQPGGLVMLRIDFVQVSLHQEFCHRGLSTVCRTPGQTCLFVNAHWSTVNSQQSTVNDE